MAGEIEFLDPEPVPGHDECLTPPGTHRGQGTIGRVVAGLAVTALIVGLLVTRAVAGDDGSSADAQRADPSLVATSGPSYVGTSPQPSVSAIESGSPGSIVALPVRTLCVQPVRQGGGYSECVASPAAVCPEGTDGLSACTTVSTLPAAVIAAVRDRYPGSVVTSAFTEIARETRLIWYRSVMVTVNSNVALTITLEQSGHDPGTSGVRNYSGLVQETRAVHVGQQLNTILEYSGRFGRRTTRSQLSMLAADARLATVG